MHFSLSQPVQNGVRKKASSFSVKSLTNSNVPLEFLTDQQCYECAVKNSTHGVRKKGHGFSVKNFDKFKRIVRISDPECHENDAETKQC